MTSRWLKYLILLYIALIPLSKVWTLPLTGSSIQPAELVFFCILVFTVLFHRSLIARSISLFRKHLSLLMLLAVSAGVVLVHLDQMSIMNGLGTIYLIVACIVLTAVFKRYKHWLKWALIAYLAGSCILSLSAIYGGVLKWVWGPAGDLALTQTMPWVGQIHRVCGFAETPTMLGMSLAPALIILLFSGKHLLRTYQYGIALVLIGLAGLASLSKALVLLSIVVVAIWGVRQDGRVLRWIATTVSAVLLAGLIFMLHFYPTSKNSDPEFSLVLEQPSFKLADRFVYPTNYVLSHAICLKLGTDNFWTGVGPGNIPLTTDRELFDNNAWQDAAERIRPGAHNWWLGAFASMGILGLVALLFFTVQVIGILRTQLKHQSYIGTIIATVLLFWLTEGLVTDVLHFRPGWLFLAFGMASDRID